MRQPDERALDCESFDSALDSCAALLGVTPQDLLARVRGFEYEALPQSARRTHPYEELFFLETFGNGRPHLPMPRTVAWFHSTRVTAGATFPQGLLPLSAALDGIWTFLGALAAEWVTPRQWQGLREAMPGQGGQQYARKVTSEFAEGPFGSLVREMIFQAEQLGNHNYLRLPEIVEDICLSFEEMYGKPLRTLFMDRTRPCIVKFQSRTERPDALEAALMYIHRKSRGEDLATSVSPARSYE